MFICIRSFTKHKIQSQTDVSMVQKHQEQRSKTKKRNSSQMTVMLRFFAAQIQDAKVEAEFIQHT